MALRVGQLIKGARATYQLLQPLKTDAVFKARVVDAVDLHENWAVIKTCSDELDRRLLRREYRNYQIPDIANSPYIRHMHEAIGAFDDQGAKSDTAVQEPPCLVLEWMDTDSWHVPPKSFRINDAKLPKAICRSVLSALATFKKHGKVHTDINPNNILLSKLDSAAPEAKVADLGILINEGVTKDRLQSLPCRAPEVWKGYGVCHASDVWSVGVTLAHCLIGEVIFGAADKILEGHTDGWCIAKIERLVGPMGIFNGPTEIEDDFDLAAHIRDLDVGPPTGKLIKVRPLREELERITDPPVPAALLDFIDSLLVLDQENRPTAEQALQHPFLR